MGRGNVHAIMGGGRLRLAFSWIKKGGGSRVEGQACICCKGGGSGLHLLDKCATYPSWHVNHEEGWRVRLAFVARVEGQACICWINEGWRVRLAFVG